MSHPLISVAELQTRMQQTFAVGAELDQATAFIEDASALVRQIAGTDFHDATGALLLPEAVRPVVVAMVQRALIVPPAAAAGLTGEQIGAYGWQAGGGGGAGQPAASIYATRRERGIIRRAAGKLPLSSMTFVGDFEQTPPGEVIL